jgi:magnesium and cobalt exporter, CNNM family
MEDVMEALIGSIEQKPSLRELSGPKPVGGEDDGSLLLSGLTRLEELEEVIGLQAERAAREHVQTLGGLVMAHLGRLPSVGDEVHLASRHLRVEEMDGHRVALVRVLPGQPDAHPG